MEYTFDCGSTCYENKNKCNTLTLHMGELLIGHVQQQAGRAAVDEAGALELQRHQLVVAAGGLLLSQRRQQRRVPAAIGRRRGGGGGGGRRIAGVLAPTAHALGPARARSGRFCSGGSVNRKDRENDDVCRFFIFQSQTTV